MLRCPVVLNFRNFFRRGSCWLLFVVLLLPVGRTRDCSMTNAPSQPWRFLASWPLAGLLVASACAAPVEPGAELIDQLARTLGERRLFEARLSGGAQEDFAWAQCEWSEIPAGDLLHAALNPPPHLAAGPVRLASLKPMAEAPDLVPAARCSALPSVLTPEGRALHELGIHFGERPAADASASLWRAHGLWMLIHGESGRALTYLRHATDATHDASAEEQGKAWSDRAAAHLVQAERHDQPEHLALALDAAETAVEVWPAGAAGWFNRALAMEKLGLGFDAAAAWEDVLGLAERSGWNDEARERLQRLRKPTLAQRWPELREDLATAALAGDLATVQTLVATAPSAARRWGEDELLGEWAGARQTGNSSAAERALAVTEAVGRALVENGGDALLADVVAEIEAAPPDPGREAALIHGLRAFARGQEHEKSYASAAATAAFQESAEALRRADSLFSVRPMVQLAVADYRASRLLACIDSLDSVEGALAPARYPAVAGRLSWLRGLCLGGAGRSAEAQDEYRRGARHFQRAGEPGMAAYLLVLLSEYQAFLGDSEMAWRTVYPALVLRPYLQQRRRQHVILDQAQELAARVGLREARLVFARSLVGLERLEASDIDDAHALLRLYEALEGQGYGAEARNVLDQAARSVAALAEGRVRQRLEADVTSARAGLLARRDPREAREYLASTVSHYRQGDRRFELPRLLRQQAALAERMGDHSAALENLAEAFTVTEAQLRATEDTGMLRSHAGELADTARQWVALLVEEDRFLEALEVVERSRARDLLEVARRAHPATAPRLRPVLELAAELPAGRTVVEYLALPEQLVAWVIRRQGVEGFVLPVSRETLRAEVRAIRDAVQAEEPEQARMLGRRLSRAVLQPMASMLGSETPVFVPDDALHGLPFSALVDDVTTISEKVSVTPSLTFYVAMLERQRRFGADFEGGPALVLGDPLRPEGRLPPLPGALDEARRVGRELGVEPVVRAAAHRRAFLERAGQAEVIYFAGHAQNNSQRPELSFLALAPSPDGNEDGSLHAYAGNVYAHEIARMDLSRVRRVVLMACSTAGEEGVGERGMTLAHAFLAAGVGGVEATLWAVEDQPAPPSVNDW